MIKYTLSWEEFLDTYRSHLPERNRVKLWVQVLGASICAALAIVLSERDEKTPLGTIFFVLALVLFIWTYWEHSIAFPEKRRLKEHELQSSYAGRFSREKTLTFDQAQWNVETPTSNRKTLWVGLEAASECHLTIALWAEDQVVIVPKRALTAEQLESLRLLALGEGKGMTPFHAGPFDYVFTEIPSFWRRHPPSLTSCFVVLMFIFACVKNMGAEGPVVLLGMALGVVGLSAAILTTQFVYFSADYIVQWRTNAASWEGEFSERGTRIRTPVADTFLVWTHLAKFRETNRCFLVYLDHIQYYLFAKKGLTSDQQIAMRQLLKSKLKAE